MSTRTRTFSSIFMRVLPLILLNIAECCTLKSRNSTVGGGVGFLRYVFFCFYWSISLYCVVDEHKKTPLTAVAGLANLVVDSSSYY